MMRVRFDFKRKMPVPKPDPTKIGPKYALTDREMLDLLDRIEGGGLSYEAAGAPYGMSRSAVAGMVWRIKTDLAASESPKDTGPRAVKAENKDGALGRRWWERVGAQGLRRAAPIERQA